MNRPGDHKDYMESMARDSANPYHIKTANEQIASPRDAPALPGGGLTLMLFIVLAVHVVLAALYAIFQVNGSTADNPLITQFNSAFSDITVWISLAEKILIAMWFYRAHKNLSLIGIENTEYSPGWAAGSFFIPILNLFRPYQICKEIWNASDPRFLGARRSEWRAAGWPRFVVFWWIWSLGGALTLYAPAVLDLQETQATLLSNVLLFAYTAADAALLIMLIWTIDSNQARCAAKQAGNKAMDSEY